MATSSKLDLAVKGGVIDAVGITRETAKAASELLQKNHDEHHIFFNADGFHNHIVHLLLAQYDLGAPAATLSASYARESSYQRPFPAAHNPVITSLNDLSTWPEYLGKQKHYPDFLRFFQEEISNLGWEETVKKWLFAGTERSEDMFVRLFAGLLHPFIHLGYGMEFQQPSIVAEALAQTAVHETWIGDLLKPAEEAARGKDSDKTLWQLLQEARSNTQLRSAAHYSDSQKIRDGILERAGPAMISLASQWTVSTANLHSKAAQSINFATAVTGSALRADKAVKFDFFLLHCSNAALWVSVFLAQPWLSDEQKARIVEWKGRMDLAQYIARACPELRIEEIQGFKGTEDGNRFFSAMQRALRVVDDGHCVKFVRALAHGERVCREYEGQDGFVVSGDMWGKLAEMVVESVGTGSTQWIRGAGFDEAWAEVEARV